jgi:electron transport complex protein RnfG
MVVLGCLGSAAQAAEISRQEALAMAFPGAVITDERVFLTDEQLRTAAALAREEIPSALVARYTALRNGKVVGHAYVDTHVVRTKKETLLISLDADGRLRRVDVTAFTEPVEYAPPERWLGQYVDQQLADDLALNRAIRPIAGATLTGRSVNAAVRRVLAIDAILREEETP